MSTSRIYRFSTVQSAKKIMTARLHLEELETRIAPAALTYRWDPVNGNNWTERWHRVGLAFGTNWELYNLTFGYWYQSGTLPSASDYVEFVDSNKSCIVNAPVTVAGILNIQNYAASIKLQDTLTINGNVLFDSNTAAIMGYTDPTTQVITRGTLIVSGTSTFFWNNGALRNMTLDAGINTTVSLGGASCSMQSATLDIAFNLNWKINNVGVQASIAGQPASQINIKKGASKAQVLPYRYSFGKETSRNAVGCTRNDDRRSVPRANGALKRT